MVDLVELVGLVEPVELVELVELEVGRRDNSTAPPSTESRKPLPCFATSNYLVGVGNFPSPVACNVAGVLCSFVSEYCMRYIIK